MGKSQQRKGRHAEQELSAILNSYGFSTKPAPPLNFGTIPDVTGMPGLHLEVKRHERTSLTEWLRQAQTDSEKFNDGVAVVVHRQNRQGWIVSMTLDNFVKIYKKGFTDGQ